MNSEVLYLNQKGKTHGPFTGTQIAELYLQQRLGDFEWFWDNAGQAWRPIEELIGTIKAKNTTEYTGNTEVRPQTEETQSQSVILNFPARQMAPPISVICFDHDSTLSGELQRATENRIWVKCRGTNSPPNFQSGSEVMVNLLSEASLATFTGRCSVISIQTLEKEITLELNWIDRSPELIKQIIDYSAP